jgi:putative spermidine/putrescine transport system substrate-binding protein
MKFRMLLVATALAFAGGFAGGVGAQTLNVVTAGDQNMVDYVNNYLAPKFEKMNPGVKVRAVGTGPGDSGSQKIYEKLSAQQKANVAEWDVDVAVVHQRGAATMVGEKLLMPYRNDIAAGKLVTRDTAKNALGPTSTAMFCRCFTARSRLPTTPS